MTVKDGWMLCRMLIQRKFTVLDRFFQKSLPVFSVLWRGDYGEGTCANTGYLINGTGWIRMAKIVAHPVKNSFYILILQLKVDKLVQGVFKRDFIVSKEFSRHCFKFSFSFFWHSLCCWKKPKSYLLMTMIEENSCNVKKRCLEKILEAETWVFCERKCLIVLVLRR